MSNIKIFVSHRIDFDSEIVENQIYTPIKCGAVYDEEHSSIMLGDDTGDNISNRRSSFCEFTVQYWAWKNIDADYYGLCHYRRYLSFSKKRYKTQAINVIREPRLTNHEKKKYGFINIANICAEVEKYDMIITESSKASDMSNCGESVTTVKEMWESYYGTYFVNGTVDIVLQLIQQYFPIYYESACEYLDGSLHRAFNCYVMKKALFNRMCDFEFTIMFEYEKKTRENEYIESMKRAIGYVGEMLNGVFIHHVLTKEQCNSKQVQLVFFANTKRLKSKSEYYKYRIYSITDKAIRKFADMLFPMFSPRREAIKKILFKITPLKPSLSNETIYKDRDSLSQDYSSSKK